MHEAELFSVPSSNTVSLTECSLKRLFKKYYFLNRRQKEHVELLLYHALAIRHFTIVEEFVKLINYCSFSKCGNTNRTSDIQSWILYSYKKLYERRDLIDPIKYYCPGTSEVSDPLPFIAHDLFRENKVCDCVFFLLDVPGIVNQNKCTVRPLYRILSGSGDANSFGERQILPHSRDNITVTRKDLDESPNDHAAPMMNYRFPCTLESPKNCIPTDTMRNLAMDIQTLKNINNTANINASHEIVPSSPINIFDFAYNPISSCNSESSIPFPFNHENSSPHSSNESWKSSDFSDKSTDNEDSVFNSIILRSVALANQNSISALKKSFNCLTQSISDISSNDSIVYRTQIRDSDLDDIDAHFSSGRSSFSFRDESPSNFNVKLSSNHGEITKFFNSSGNKDWYSDPSTSDSSSENCAILNLSEISSPSHSQNVELGKSHLVLSWLQEVSNEFYENKKDLKMEECSTYSNPPMESVIRSNYFDEQRDSFSFIDTESAEDTLFCSLETPPFWTSSFRNKMHTEGGSLLDDPSASGDAVYPFKSRPFASDCNFVDNSEHIRSVNEKWEQTMFDVSDGPKAACKVSFASDANLVTVHIFEKPIEDFLPDTEALDHVRFQCRIRDFDFVLGPFLSLDHRAKVLKRNHIHQN